MHRPLAALTSPTTHIRSDDNRCTARARTLPKWSRNLACALAAVLVAGFGCRPKWSEDGKRLVYPAHHDKQHFVTEHDFETGQSRTLLELQPQDGAADILWDKDNSQWVVVSADGVDDNTINVFTLDTAGKQRDRHQIRVKTRNVSCLLSEPVIVDGHVFITGNSITRVNLKSGETTTDARRGMGAFPLGDDLGYVNRTGNQWSIGKLDPKTFEATPWVEQPKDCAWQIQPHPRFNASHTRCAVIATQGLKTFDLTGAKWAILVLEQGKLISTIELKGELSTGPLAWIDEVTVCATVMRPGEEVDTFAMLETDFSGNVQRETVILKAPVDEKMARNGGGMYALNMPFLMRPSPSPDGKTVAFSTAKLPRLPADLSGLLLLRRSKLRPVERLAFGPPNK